MAMVAAAAIGIYATCIEPYRPVVRRRTIAVPSNWPPLEILHISDLHLRRSNCRLFRAQVKAMQALSCSPVQPDLVCVTGDLCEQVEDVPLIETALAPLSPRLGVFVGLGNHEYNAPMPPGLGFGEAISSVFSGLFAGTLSRGPREAEAIASELRKAGFRILRNEGLRLEVGQRGLWLGVVDSAWAGRADVDAALRGRTPGDGALLMIHEPDVAFESVQRGADVVLAGHTHGGQVRLPIIGAPYSHRIDHRVRIAAGVQQIGKSRLHITTGLGQLLPLRLGCPPEAVWISCRPG